MESAWERLRTAGKRIHARVDEKSEWIPAFAGMTVKNQENRKNEAALRLHSRQ